jgi:hypothetical protein
MIVRADGYPGEGKWAKQTHMLDIPIGIERFLNGMSHIKTFPDTVKGLKGYCVR